MRARPLPLKQVDHLAFSPTGDLVRWRRRKMPPAKNAQGKNAQGTPLQRNQSAWRPVKSGTTLDARRAGDTSRWGNAGRQRKTTTPGERETPGDVTLSAARRTENVRAIDRRPRPTWRDSFQAGSCFWITNNFFARFPVATPATGARLNQNKGLIHRPTQKSSNERSQPEFKTGDG